jgi:serine/threonine-protein kinase RsbW
VAGTGSFRVDESRVGGDRKLVAAGELDSGTHAALVEAFERAARELEGRQLELDLSALTFIDSAGLRAIIHVERSARERGLMLVVTPPPAPLTELLELTGLADRLTLRTHADEPPRFRPFVERVEVSLPSELTAASRARGEVRQAAGMLDDDVLDAAVLLTSELVANAVIHPASPDGAAVQLRITCYEDGVRCEITDPGPGFDPANLGPRNPDSGGRGLLLVDALASRWGTARPDGGFCVWFEVDAPGD